MSKLQLQILEIVQWNNYIGNYMLFEMIKIYLSNKILLPLGNEKISVLNRPGK